MKQRTKTFTFLLFTVLSASLYGQTTYDSTYIWDRRNRLNASLFLENKIHALAFINGSNDPYYLSTNNAIVTPGIQATYKWLNLRLKLPIKSWQTNVEEEGNTTNYAFALGATSRNWWARAYYEYNKGYYSDNLFTPGVKFIHPNFKIQQFNLNFDYAFNGQRYSHRQTLWQSEVQLKSAGTFFVGGTISAEWIDNDSILIPASAQGDFGIIEKMRDINFIYPGIHVGYTYTYVPHKGWNITAYLAPGLSVYSGSYTDTNQQRFSLTNSFGWVGEFNGTIGYSRNNWYANLSINQYMSLKYLDSKDAWLNLQSYIRIGFGYRFNNPQQKWLKPLGL